MTSHRRRRSGVAVLLVFALLALVGCDDTAGKPKPYQTAGGPVRLPDPQPDHGPGGPKTPGPVAGDPNPHDPEHQYTVWLTWSPVKNFIQIDWVIGTDDGPMGGALQRQGGKFSKNGKARDSGRGVMVIGAVYDATALYPITINCWITKNGVEVVRRSSGAIYRSTRGMLGVSCEAPD